MAAKFAAIAMAASAASAAVGFMGNMAAASNAKKIGEGNAQLALRDGLVAENNKIALQQKLELDLDRADDTFAELQSETGTAYRYSGVDPTEGTPLDVMIRNVERFAFDKEIARYNTKIEQAGQTEIQAFSTMKADLFRLQGATQAGQYRMKGVGSLLGGAQKTAMIGHEYFPNLLSNSP